MMLLHTIIEIHLRKMLDETELLYRSGSKECDLIQT